MSVDLVDVYNVVWIEPAFMIEMFLREFTLVQVVEESVVRHDVWGVEGAADALLAVLAHYYSDIIGDYKLFHITSEWRSILI